MKALIIDEPWIGRILAGSKTWEMRSRLCRYRGPIALIKKGSKHVVGVARVVDCRPAITDAMAFAKAERFHGIRPTEQAAAFEKGWTTAWVLADARAIRKPVAYLHTAQVNWVTLSPDVAAKVSRQMTT